MNLHYRHTQCFSLYQVFLCLPPFAPFVSRFVDYLFSAYQPGSPYKNQPFIIGQQANYSKVCLQNKVFQKAAALSHREIKSAYIYIRFFSGFYTYKKRVHALFYSKSLFSIQSKRCARRFVGRPPF